ncbi:acyltransferase family protein [Candidatus Poribacteria bacterium]|nr:acyltransferase family protein [Candidatus Poribacteria bacterium]
MNQTSERRHDLDALRAVAMLLGIVLHAGLSFVTYGWIVQDSRTHWAFDLVVTAIHGFRMPMFFVMSGFFTAMLWRRRGLRPLLWHRIRRIALPLALCMITVIPAMNWASGIALTSGAKVSAGAYADVDPRESIWTAARAGDVGMIEQSLEKGADIDEGDPQTGVAPLALATLFGQPEAVDALIQLGADVNGRDRLGSTALHGAAFLGRVKAARLLVGAGADLDARNSDNATPYDSLSVDWGTTLFIAGLLGIHPDEQQVEEGRKAVSALFDAVPTDRGANPGQDGKSDKDDLSGILGWLLHASVFHHLWFLWHLCWLVLAFAIYATLADGFGWRGLSSRVMLSPARWLWLVPVTMVPQWFMLGFGPDTSAGILPMPPVLGYYAIFFFYGVLYYDSDEGQGRADRWWPITVPTAVFAVVPLALTLDGDLKNAIDAPVGLVALRLGATALKVVYAWLMTFGLMGMFQALVKAESRALRYVSDSSYWLYIAHLPLIILAQAWVRYWPLPSVVKFAMICLVVTGVLLLAYQTVVRYTVVGTMLNGPRQRPRKVVADAS